MISRKVKRNLEMSLELRPFGTAVENAKECWIRKQLVTIFYSIVLGYPYKFGTKVCAIIYVFRFVNILSL
jgi:hypothetical protein